MAKTKTQEMNREFFVECGKRSTGWKKMKQKPRSYFSEIGKKGAQKRNENMLKNKTVDNPVA